MRHAAPVRVPEIDHVAQLSVGADEACALRGDGAVFCWGSNLYGALGGVTTIAVTSPVRVAGLP